MNYLIELTTKKEEKNGLILEQLLLGDFQIADLSGFWVQPRQDLSIGLST